MHRKPRVISTLTVSGKERSERSSVASPPEIDLVIEVANWKIEVAVGMCSWLDAQTAACFVESVFQ
jgi:hypothetical protein